MKSIARSARGIVLVVLLVWSAAQFATPAIAQDDFCEDNDILFLDYGDSIDSELDDRVPAEVFCFEGEEDESILITMEVTDGDLEPIIVILDATAAEQLAASDEGDEGDTVEVELTLPEDGNYIILAGRVDFDEGRSEGEYTLTLELSEDEAGSADEDNSGPEALLPTGAVTCDDLELDVDVDSIAYDETVEGEISDDEYAIYYCFEGLEDDEISITMRATDGDLDTLVLITPDGDEILALNDDIDTDGGVTDSQLEFTLPEDGAYLIVATRYDTEVGDTEGEYELTLTLLDGPSTEAPETETPEEPEPTPTEAAAETEESTALAATCDAVELDAFEVTTIEYGEGVEGEITNDAFAQVYCFEGSAGDSVTISMQATDGDLDTYLLLTDSVLDETFAENDDNTAVRGSTDSLIAFTLPQDGAYLIVATRLGTERGDSEGTYALELTLGEAAAQAEDDPTPTPTPTSSATPTEGATEASAPERCANIELDEGELVTLAYGDTVEGEISDDQPVTVYCFEGAAGDEIVISMVATDGDLDTFLVLTDSSYEINLAENDDVSSRNTDSEILFTLEEDGVYLIAATRFEITDGDSSGTYELTLDLAGGK